MTNFTRRIVLVHPLQHNSILDLMYKLGKDHLVAYDTVKDEIDLPRTTVNAVIVDDTILKDDAIIGSHLAFNVHQYTQSFVDRPHIHWWWNGLFQANSGGDWENSLVAFLEPLDAVEKVMGCAPYDTMTMGPHKLSENSCIVVPHDSVEPLQTRLKDYQGKIVGFDPASESIRSAINRILKENYPHSYTLTGKGGYDINQVAMSDGKRNFNYPLATERGYNCSTGYFEHISLQIDSEEPIPLLRGENEPLMEEYKLYSSGRFIGLHSHSPTDVESNHLIKLLRTVSISPNKIHRYAKHFISQSTKLNDLCVLEAFKVYEKLMAYAPITGMHDYATYLLKKALIADLRSIHSDAQGNLNFQLNDLQNLIDCNYQRIVNRLETLSNALSLPDDNELRLYKQQLLEVYFVFLKHLPESMHKFSKTTQSFYSTPAITTDSAKAP